MAARLPARRPAPAPPPAPARARASGSASGTGLSLEDTQTAGTGDALVASAVAEYTDYVSEQVDETIAATTVFTDAVRAGNLQAAQGGLRPEPRALGADRADRRPHRGDRRRGGRPRRRLRRPERPDLHRLAPPRVPPLEPQDTTEGAARFADQLDADLATLKTELSTLEIPPAAVALGASELIEEVSQGKITGEEDRYSKTDLWDFNANVEGARRSSTS